MKKSFDQNIIIIQPVPAKPKSSSGSGTGGKKKPDPFWPTNIALAVTLVIVFAVFMTAVVMTSQPQADGKNKPVRISSFVEYLFPKQN